MSGGYEAKDYVDIVDAEGNPIDGFAHPVPKQWIGTDLLPAGAKKKGGGRSSGGRSTQPATPSGDGDKGQQSPDPEVFDPSKHNQDEVLAYLADAEPDEVDRVKAAEAEGDGRKGIAAFEPAAPSSEDNKTESEGS